MIGPTTEGHLRAVVASFEMLGGMPDKMATAGKLTGEAVEMVARVRAADDPALAMLEECVVLAEADGQVRFAALISCIALGEHLVESTA